MRMEPEVPDFACAECGGYPCAKGGALPCGSCTMGARGRALHPTDLNRAPCVTGGDCGLCGWSAGNATQFLLDEDGTRVARLTNRSGQLGALWLREPQPVHKGFYANFTFRISQRTLCMLPLEVFGSNSTATVGADRSFVPLDEMKEAGQAVSHYLTDHPSLPFEPLRPPMGTPSCHL